jgi:hypothetical protein
VHVFENVATNKLVLVRSTTAAEFQFFLALMPFKLRDVAMRSRRGTVLANSAHGKTLDNVPVSPKLRAESVEEI